MVFDFYKHLHRMPELSEAEYNTASFIEESLQAWGYTTKRVSNTGVIADLVVDEKLPWLMFRADIDGLPIQENSGVSYASENPGVMHACGHDGHTAMLLEAARKLYGEKLPQNIRFLFQPGEESSMGAAKVLQEDILPQNLKACFAMHVWPGVPKCTLATCEGALMASCDFFKISFHGKSAHCAQAHLGHDALQAAVMMAGRINEIKSQIQEKMILFCGNIHSGEGYNIVPSEAIVGGTVRTFSNDVQKRVVKELEQAAKECAEKVGADYSVEWLGYTAPLNNAPDIVEELAQFLPELNAHAAPSYAAEDFALYQEKVPGVLMWLGTGDTAPLHNECFYVPEEVLYAGVEGWLKIAKHTFASGGAAE